MTSSTTFRFPQITALIAVMLSTTSLAGIREIPPEEMTEAYIRDNTVVIPRQNIDGQTGNTVQNIDIKPLDTLPGQSSPQSGTDSTARPDLTPLTDQYLSEQRDQSLQQQLSPQYPATNFDPLRSQREEYLRAVLGLESGAPIDFSQLQFPTTAIPDTPPPAGIGHTIAPGQFTISIPNSSGYAPSSHQTPGGEYQINVTPSDIIFTINLPQQ